MPGVKVVGASRFSREMVAGNPLDRLYASSVQTKRLTRRVVLDYQDRRRGIHGIVKRDDQWELRLSFSNDEGQSFSDTLVGAEPNRVYQLRMSISQLQAEPLLRGFRTGWYLPAGWMFADNLGRYIYDETVSNPMVVTRVIRAPSPIQAAAFEVRVLTVYR